MRLQRSGPAALLGLLSLVLLGQGPEASAPREEPAAGAGPPASHLPLSLVAKDLAGFGFAVTAGAAPGYADERSCALCHASISRSYQEKGMARAFRRPRPESDIEDFVAPPFRHAASGQTFQIVRRGDRLVFRRWQLDSAGKPVNLLEQPVDWILGSGDHARTYLYQTPGGELFQLPLAWYSQTRSWAMAPGFDRPDHEGVRRRVRRECVFCHTSYPDVPAGADSYGSPQTFPPSLPEGVGCQRCHGPAAEHVWLALGGVGVREEIRGSVFNPARLPAGRRDEICLTCHLQPSVALPGVRRFGRGDFSFRPGEPPSDYLVQVDVEEEGRLPADRFEINHHPYRLRQSRCFLASGRALSCLTCHDPHRRIPEAERAAHFRAACLTCHQPLDCKRTGKGKPAGAHATDPGDCVSCHMPKRRTQDVVHVVMTDHLIRRRPGGPELLAPLEESTPVLTDVRLLGPGAPAGALGEVYRAATVVRMIGTADSVGYLEKMLMASRPAELDPWLDLVQGLLRRRQYAQAEQTLAGILAKSPGHPLALECLALARAGQGRTDEAIELLRRTLSASPERAEIEYNLGRLLQSRGQSREAAVHLERVLAFRPNFVDGWYHLGELRAAEQRWDDAIACWRRALEIDPSYTAASLALAKALSARDGSPVPD